MDQPRQHGGLSEKDREWRRRKLLERNLPLEQLPYRENREARRRVRLASVIYANALMGENLRMWPKSALEELACACASAALAMTHAEAAIFAHYAAERSRKGKEATDGHDQAD